MLRLAMILPVVFLALAAMAPAGDEPKAEDPKANPKDAPKVEPKPADGDAPLAKGFPDATRPGEIEVKTYPAYRGAVTRREKVTAKAGNLMFFALFNHIQTNKIAMTAPVISTFETPALADTPGAKGRMSMEFVYREPEMGKAGADGESVEVVDHPARPLVCLGFQGDDPEDRVRVGVAQLRTWLDDHKAEYEADGPPRLLGYHGPMTPVAKRWWEVQIPVKKVKAKE